MIQDYNYGRIIEYLSERDEILSEIIIKIGACTLSSNNYYFSSLTRIIINQQLSIKAGNAIYNRLIKSTERLSPHSVMSLHEEDFRKIGISRKKQLYLKNLSELFISDEIDFNIFFKLTDEEILKKLQEIKGIGKWSAEMFMIFSLNRLDILPLTDSGFLRSFQINYNYKKDNLQENILKHGNKWRPYRSIAVWYLWQSINEKKVVF